MFGNLDCHDMVRLVIHIIGQIQIKVMPTLISLLLSFPKAAIQSLNRAIRGD